MIPSTLKQIGLFLLAFFLYVIFTYIARKSCCQIDTSMQAMLIVCLIGLIYTLMLIGYVELVKPFGEESYKLYKNCQGSSTQKSHQRASSLSQDEATPPLGISPGKLCKGGPYTWQGNSPRATMCRSLASTLQGKEEINRFNCGKGYTGIPRRGFNFTPLSDDSWENARCKDISCDVKNNSILL